MKKVLSLEINTPTWGRTSEDVLLQVQSIVSAANTPAPFESEPDPVYLGNIRDQVAAACETATKARRKGMMASSQFSVMEIGDSVFVHHVRNKKANTLFLTIVKINDAQQT